MSIFSQLFGNLIPAKCPISDTDREWVEDSFLWFAKEFGLDVIRKHATITPTPNFFPDKYTASYEEIETLVHSICKWMNIDPRVVDLRFFVDDKQPIPMPMGTLGTGTQTHEGAAGLYAAQDGDKEFILALEASIINDPVALVATIAHELSHAHLIGSGRVTAEEEDQEPLTDLLAIYWGMGIFIANAAFCFKQWENGQLYGWKASRHGYLPDPVLGYGLGLYALTRGESNPPWECYLEYSVKVFLRNSLKFLNECDLSHLSSIIEPTCS